MIMKSAKPQNKRGITEREMTPAQRRKAAELRQEIAERHKKKLHIAGMKRGSVIETAVARHDNMKDLIEYT